MAALSTVGDFDLFLETLESKSMETQLRWWVVE